MIFILTLFGLLSLTHLNRLLINKNIFKLWVFLAPYLLLLSLIGINLYEDVYYNNLYNEPFTTIFYQLITAWCAIGGYIDIHSYYKFINIQQQLNSIIK